MSWRRREVLISGAAAAILAACKPSLDQLSGGWVGASADRGHRLRELTKSGSMPQAAVQRHASVVVIGAGIAGLAAARELARRGIEDVHLLELEDTAGGNSRGHVMAGMACPLGAHYLPVPLAPAREVLQLLEDFGLMRSGRVIDDAALCHSPQERLFIDGEWVDGFLPPAAAPSSTLDQYRRFGALVAQAQRDVGFAIPTHRAPWTPAHAVLDAESFDRWLDAQSLTDHRLRWYLDYCCRDDYGAGSATVSAWAGLHYFASRHGFHAPGDDDAEREPVFTWPEGNAWLANRMIAPLGDRVYTARTALRIEEGRHAVSVLAWDESQHRAEAWTADHVVLAMPLFIAARVLNAPPAALIEAAGTQPRAPWLVANLQLDEPLVERPGGAPASWDNVRFSDDARALGYVDAMHQSTRPYVGATVLSAYWALPTQQRSALLNDDWRTWARRVISDLAVMHPDLPAKVRRADLMRHGHAMSIPVPGLRGSAALAALRQSSGRLRFAHADLSAYSVFEEAYTAGCGAGESIAISRSL